MLNTGSYCFKNIQEKWFCPEEEITRENESDTPDPSLSEAPTSKQWTKAEMLKEFRKFNFDLSPKVRKRLHVLFFKNSLTI